jgi:N-acetylmuramoyl-L-alanine amidase
MDSVSEKLTCSDTEHIIVFTRDNHFYSSGDSLRQLAVPPRRVDGSLFLATAEIERVFNTVNTCLGVDTILKTLHVCTKIYGNGVADAGRAVVDDVGDRAKGKLVQAQAIRTIVIDPGHGGKDPGAIGPNGIREKDVVLGIALRIRDLLKTEKSLQVFMTRETDVFIPLVKRTAFANEKKADIFISIHANSIQGNKQKRTQVKGYKIYFLSQAKNEEDKLVAMIENSVIEFEDERDRGNYLQNILIDMANNEYLAESEDMSIMIAETFAGQIKELTSLHRGVGQAPFWVLNGAFMPSVLVETAFISNPGEEKMLADVKFQKRISNAVYKAIIRFKEKYEAEL